jgi:hypothetical protein
MAYNTVPFHGKVCQVEKNNVAMDFGLGWSISASLDMADASRAAQNWKEGLPGMAGWNGSFSGQVVLGNTEQKAFLDNLITAAPGTKLTDVKFLLDGSTNAYTGNIFITGYSCAPGIGGVVTHTFTFQGDGAMSVTSAA